MKETKESQGSTIVPAVHLEFIQNQAGLPEDQGLDEIETYHRAVFLHHHARELERCRQQGRIQEDRVVHLESRLAQARAKLAGQDKLVPVNANGQLDTLPNAPWNAWDRFMFILAGAGIVCLLAFGVLNISFNLLESGLVTFLENPVRSYFWAALLPIGALGVKIGWDFLENQRRRNLYLWVCLATGTFGVLAWLAAYSAVYPTLSKSTAEHIESLSVFDPPALRAGAAGPGSAKIVDALIVAAQAIAEIFLSAALGIYMTQLYARHRPVRLAGNPLFLQLDEDRRLLEDELAQARLALGDAHGEQRRLENQLAALLAFAKSLFQKESALRRDQSQQKRLALDQISDQLRTQLQIFENNGLPDKDRTAPMPLASSHRQ